MGESSKLKFQAIKVFEILKFSYLKKVWISLNTNYKKNAPFFEWTDHDNPAPIIKNPLQVVEGHIQLPSGPGLGMDIDLNALDNQTAEIIKPWKKIQTS